MSTRIEGIIDRLTDAESFDDIKWIVGDGIIRNYAQSIVDDHIKANAEFQGKAGLEVTVERVSVGKTCKWCLARCGKFTYPDVPKGTWDRHVDCDCYIIYDNGRVRQTLSGKDTKWNVVSEEVSERKKVGLTKPTAKELEARKIVGLESDTENAKEYSDGMLAWKRAADANDVKYNAVAPLDKELSTQDIIDRLGGGDKTKGSCASLGLAYIGNKAGLDVLDFRGGNSQSLFASYPRLKNLFNMNGVKGRMISGYNDFKTASDLLSDVEEGKEYYFAISRHAAIVRKVDGQLEYLELQSGYDIDGYRNGFYKLDRAALKRRFRCTSSHTSYGMKYEAPGLIIDAESLYNNDEFAELLGYMNTATDKQKKGISGGIK